MAAAFVVTSIVYACDVASCTTLFFDPNISDCRGLLKGADTTMEQPNNALSLEHRAICCIRTWYVIGYRVALSFFSEAVLG